MAKSKSLAKPVPQSMTEARDWLRKFGEAERAVENIKLALNDEIALLKQSAEEDAASYKAQIKELQAGIKAWAEANKSDLCKASKTVDLGVGQISWKHRPPSVSISGGAPAVIERLNEQGLLEFIRVKEELNKEAMLANPIKAMAVTGITIRSAGETFSIEVFEHDLSEEDAA